MCFMNPSVCVPSFHGQFSFLLYIQHTHAPCSWLKYGALRIIHCNTITGIVNIINNYSAVYFSYFSTGDNER